jgi:hypothetical protein
MTSPSNLRDETSPCFPYLSKTFKIVVGFTFPMTLTVPCSASRTTEYTPTNKSRYKKSIVKQGQCYIEIYFHVVIISYDKTSIEID